MKNVTNIIQTMPKVELHLHLEGAFTFEFLFDLIQKYGGDPSVKTVDDLEKRFVFKDFPHFIETWFWKNKFFREAEDFENSTYFTLKDLHEQNVLYAEVFYSPWDFRSSGVSVAVITEATLAAVWRAKQDFGIQCFLIADIVRDAGRENGKDRLNEILPYRESGVIGIGLGGSEQEFPPEPFEDVYKMARESGLHVVAHAGEAAGPKSVWGAIEKLRVERIGHGVRSVEDPQLVEYLREKQIPLEVCPVSNLKTGVFPSFETHPIKYFFENDLFVTINSDDPAMFGTTITEEFLLLHEQLNFSLDDIKKLALNGARASFLQEKEKVELLVRMNEYWNRIQK